jgi:hypothetical protein
MNDARDDETGAARRLRAAEAVLDQRPSARVRQAILDAAAAGGAQAGTPPTAPAPIRPAAVGRTLPVRWRWPLAAAASVLVASLALRLATEVERTRPSAATAGAPAAESALKSSPAPSLPPSPAALPPSPAPPPQPTPAPALSERAVTPPASPPPPAADAAVARPFAAAPRAKAASGAATSQAAPEPPTPALWLERIVALRHAGSDDDADRELRRLRARYPDLRIPVEALPPVRRSAP